MARQAQLETRLREVHQKAAGIVTVLGNVQARVPGTFPENLDDMHTAIKRGELRRVLKCAEDIVAEVDAPFPEEVPHSGDGATRRAAMRETLETNQRKKVAKKAKKKTAKKKTGGG